HVEEAAAIVPPGRGEEGQRPLAALQRFLQGMRCVSVPGLPPFTGGVVGSLSYDSVRGLERLPTSARDDLGTPAVDAACYDTVVAFDHLRQRLVIVANLVPGRDGRTVREEHARAEQRIQEICTRLGGPAPAAAPGHPGGSPGPSSGL